LGVRSCHTNGFADIADIGDSTAFPVSDAARHLTGSIHYVDAGCHVVA
jgi:enoyl-[acyl-carrier-protein] reductase (NADH)